MPTGSGTKGSQPNTQYQPSTAKKVAMPPTIVMRFWKLGSGKAKSLIIQTRQELPCMARYIQAAGLVLWYQAMKPTRSGSVPSFWKLITQATFHRRAPPPRSWMTRSMTTAPAGALAGIGGEDVVDMFASVFSPVPV